MSSQPVTLRSPSDLLAVVPQELVPVSAGVFPRRQAALGRGRASDARLTSAGADGHKPRTGLVASPTRIRHATC